MKLRIVDGYLEIKGIDQHISISIPYVGRSIYGTKEIMDALDVYHQQRETPYDWPDMVWNPISEIWKPITTVNIKELELDEFISMCRRKQNVSS